jgi:hypothetical protein
MPLFYIAPMILFLHLFPAYPGGLMATDALWIAWTGCRPGYPQGLDKSHMPSFNETLRRALSGLAHSAHRPDDELYINRARGEGNLMCGGRGASGTALMPAHDAWAQPISATIGGRNLQRVFLFNIYVTDTYFLFPFYP